MANNGKDTNHTKHINGKKLKMHKIDWCEGGLKLADIVTRNFGENCLNPKIKYIMVSIDN